MDRCIKSLNAGTTAQEIEQTLTYIETCKLKFSMRHGELYIARLWKIPWDALTRHETMATKLLFIDKGTNVYSTFKTDIVHTYFDQQKYVDHVMSQLRPSLRIATQILHQNRASWMPDAERI